MATLDYLYCVNWSILIVQRYDIFDVLKMVPVLNIAPTKKDDLSEILRLERSPQNEKWIFPYTRRRHEEVLRREDEFHFTLKSEENIIIGFIILAKAEKEHNSIEFRRIVIRQKGKGLGRKCLRWIKHYCFEELNAYRVWLDVFTNNDRALALYLSEGFVREGVKRSCIASDDSRRNLLLLSMLRPEYYTYLERHKIYWN